MNTPSESPREICARIIATWLSTHDFPDRMLPEKNDNRAFIQEVVFGVVRWRQQLEWIMEPCVKRPPEPQAKSFLLIGLYQLFLMDSVPDHAALNETVEAAKQALDKPRSGFINGVLRNCLRQRDAIRERLEKAPLAIRTSHPDLLLERWTRQFGEKQTEALCNWNNERPSVAIRINSLKTSTDQYISQLDSAGIETAPHPADPSRFLQLPSGVAVNTLPGYSDGLFTVQDPATMLPVDLLDLAPGMSVLDACAAPGGKTFACAEQMGDKGKIVAIDCHEDRLIRLRQNAKRMNMSCIEIGRGDASNKVGLARIEKQGPFDRILLDVPCSNTGVLRRRADARWRFSANRLRKLVGLQARMLNACSRLIAPNGYLVYSTCSIEPEENRNQLERWVEQNPEFKINAIRESFPPSSGMDGAFAARLVRA